MPDWAVRRTLVGEHPAWSILAEDCPAPGDVYHPFRNAAQDAVKWQNQVYAVVRRQRRSLTYVPIPLPLGTAIGHTPASSDDDY